MEGQQVKIKVCGIASQESLESLSSVEPDYLGIIFYPKSQRYVEGRLAAREFISLRASSNPVGVFVDPTLDEVKKGVTEYALKTVQLHGGESPQFCAELRELLPDVDLIKAFGIDQDSELGICYAFQDVCDYFLFDTKCDSFGGSGKSFNWSLLDAYRGPLPAFLSGGLRLENAEAAYAYVQQHPWLVGIDVNSGLESSPGEKSAEHVQNFFAEIKA